MLIVFEGVDSSGKATHTEMLYNKIKDMGKKVIKISFPDYESNSSALVKMYLEGEFGPCPEDVSPYAASSFYAVDRYASYHIKWKTYLENGYIVLADRYVPSNMIHQAAKFKNYARKDLYLEWVYDFEYNKLGLPKPDRVIFLDMPPSFARSLMADRSNKFTGEKKKDIHESDNEHIINAYGNALYVAEKYNWTQIKCADTALRSIDDIQNEIMNIVLEDIRFV
jgi:dTMP kinase